MTRTGPTAWAAAKNAFEANLPGYAERPQQDALAEAVDANLERRGHLLAEAGTGVGKSLVALVHAIGHAQATGRPVVVSTGTIALQKQYVEKDIPFLREHLGVPFTAALLMGRGRYVCQAKLAGLDATEIPGLREYYEYTDTRPGWDGEVAALPTDLVPIDRRDHPKLTSSSDECPGKNSCPFGSVCYAEEAKARAGMADVIVVNHALLLTDTMVRHSSGGNAAMLPDYSALVVDEAHELESVATDRLGAEFSRTSLTKAGADVASFLEDPAAAEKISGAAVVLFDTLAALGAAAGRERTAKLDIDFLLEHQDAFFAVLDEVDALRERVLARQVPQDDVKEVGRRRRLAKRLETLSGRLSAVLGATSEELVRWVESDERRGTLLKTAPLAVGPFLAEHLWARSRFDRDGRVLDTERIPTVLLSATLSVGGDFSYLAERLGFADYTGFTAGSPFDYAQQAAVFVPKAMAAPAGPTLGTWRAEALATMDELVEASGGRALLLFTSNAELAEAHRDLEPRFRKRGLTVLRQGEAGPRELAQRFKDDETSVLFAVKTFFVGVDFRGDCCRLVIINKLTFTPPTQVVFKARCDLIDAEVARQGLNSYAHGSFARLSVPAMALDLIQGAGRAVRTTTDRALVAVLDSRLVTKRYGTQVHRALLPGAPRLGTLDAAIDYLHELEA